MDRKTEEDLRHCLKSLILQQKLEINKIRKTISAVNELGKDSLRSRNKLVVKAKKHLDRLTDITSAIDEVVEIDICKEEIDD